MPLPSTGDYLGAGVGLKLESILLPELCRGWDWRLPRLHRCRRSRCTAGAGAPLLLEPACRCRPPGNPPLPQHSADSSVLERPCCVPLLFPGVASSCISKAKLDGKTLPMHRHAHLLTVLPSANSCGQKNKPISAAPGDDVILPCHLDSEVDLQFYTVEWTKLEMDPDPTKRRFVYLYQSRKTMTRFMMETFIQRVSLNPDGLKRGDVTLKIRNVTLQDEGTYSCYIDRLDHRETVHLVVEPNGVRAPTMETSQFNISTPDPGGEQNNIWISRSRPALWISLGVFTSLIFSAVCVYNFQRRRQEFQKPLKLQTLNFAPAVRLNSGRGQEKMTKV